VLQIQTLNFLKQLKKNNNKAWFDEHKKEYEAAKQDFEGFASDLLSAFTPMVPGLATQKAKDCTYRIFRDVRFSKDKTPYKSHFGAFFSEGGRKWDGAGYYLHLEPGAMFAGGGLWMPEAPLLKRVRQEVDYDLKGFKDIIDSKAFKKLFPKIDGEALSRPPQGYEADNPAIEYLKKKSFTAGSPLKDVELTSKDAVKKVVSVFTTLQPFIGFLNRAQEV
jgi:uncharacterized protein (TIGR02453 family)